MKQSNIFILIIAIISILSCKNQGNKSSNQEFKFDEAIQKEIQEKFILVEDGGTVELPAGNFLLNKTLSVEGKKNITIKGAGKDKTILSFLGQIAGAEGINITNCDGITIEDLTVQDAKGDNIKLKGCKNVVLRNLNSTWTTGADSTNGDYGYYPVECNNVLVEKCEVSYCADAGVYVGQSTNVIVRNCYAHHNVAGIEIENCINSDIYDNLAEENSGGILVFDLPKLFQPNGRNAKLFNNTVKNNNFPNFAKPGSIVGEVPAGSGIIIMATDSVDVFGNTITDHKTAGISIVSYLMTERPINDSTYGPYCHAIYVHNNTFSRRAILMPNMKTDFGKLLVAAIQSPADVAYDGASEKELRDANGMLPDNMKICIQNNEGLKKFINLNLWKASSVKEILKSYDTDMTPFDCSYTGINGNNTPAK